ncbi:MAG: ABC transporter ATP-binding protein [Chthoniobacterales bacterium]
MNLPKTTSSFIFYFVRQQWMKFLIAILASTAWGIYSPLFPYLLKSLIDTLGSQELAPAQIYAQSRSIIGVIIVFWLICQLLLRTQGFLFNVHFCARFRASIREVLFRYVQVHSTSYFKAHFSGTLTSQISELPKSCETILNIFCSDFVTAFAMGLTSVMTMWMSHPLFAWLLLLWLCIHFLITFVFLKKGHPLLEEHASAVTKLSGSIVDVFTNIQSVKLFAHEQEEESYLHGVQHEELKKSNHAYTHLEWMQVGFSLNHTFLIVGMLFLLMYGWNHHWVSLGDFVQIMMQSFWLLGWMRFTSSQIKTFVKNLANASSTLSVIEKTNDIIDLPHAPALIVSEGEICFDQVTFAYPEKPPVFNHLNTTITAREKVGLVGLSGAGKTTFMNLILRLYDLQDGKITIDRQSIAEVTQYSLHQNIAVIPQDISLFNRTLLENIRYGRLEATDEEVIAASKKAYCHEFIKQLDKQYDSLVGESGITLSGGERQRIALARAFLKNAPILMLDEATSALDFTTEKKIQESLVSLMSNRTTIVIAHHLSTIAKMDRILVFEKGEIVEEGTIHELLKKNGHFAALWKIKQESAGAR